MNRLDYIDALRGIAALLVVFQHLFVPLLGEYWVLEHLIDPGKLGVLWFFMISGFVIPFSLKHQPSAVRRFLVSRFFRLYPAYWLSLLLFLAATRITGQPIPGWPHIVANLTMVQTVLGIPDVIGLYWTLFIELGFYALCLMLFIAGLLHSVTVRFGCAVTMLVLALAMGVARGWLDQKLPVAFPLALSLMFFGSLWRDTLLTLSSRASRRPIVMLLLAYAVLLPPTFIAGYSTDMGNGETWTRYLFTYALAFLTFLLLTTRIRLESYWLVWLGTISYSVYLLHPSIALLADWLGRQPFFALPPLGLALAATLATLLLAHLCFQHIERPFIGLGRKLSIPAQLPPAQKLEL
ncbi:peptidoglycan/LPS O-acetylase OafA/YrhL [Pseudomonas duriflava]|uniref:Peptidoglycan/LPS O-acetylase OafA/YrhL n=1 Tax=Pseudomonas duriflava TaxID=459528 RepID=A0A562PS91_9PSED|nr:acyltransferase [Pseudomonas duriflava]TWI47269.1 peptidoglycan/LPS O-acetylase OafA/YrhL [Pseudomonas duriflava]